MGRLHRRAGAEGDLIERIYGVALDDAQFPDLLESIRQFTDSATALYMLHDPTAHAGSLHMSAGVSPDLMRAYDETVIDNPRIQAAASALSPGVVASGADFISDGEFCRTRFYADFMRPLDILPDLGAIIELDGSRAASIVLCRPQSMGRYTPRERQQLQRLIGHLCRAVEIRRRLQVRNSIGESAVAALESLSAAVILINSRVDIQFASPGAEMLLRSAQPLRQQNGKLEVTDARIAHSLRQMLCEALQVHDGDWTQPKRKSLDWRDPQSARHLRITVTPIRLPGLMVGTRQPGAAIFVDIPSQREVENVESFAATHGLTSTELKVLLGLVRGLNVDAIARSLGQQPATTRSHLKRIFLKTGLHRQAELTARAVRGA